MALPRVVSTTSKEISQWVTLQEHQVLMAQGAGHELYHSLRLDDYVTILAITDNGRIPVVRQYRPAIQDFSLELPGGINDLDEDPAKTAERELYEETGFVIKQPLVSLGVFATDTGRLNNRLWAYFSSGVSLDPDWRREEGIEVRMYDLLELKDAINQGIFNHALHLSLLAVAMIKGLI